MSSTYSTNLALELIGAGEQAGNWGSTTNTNLGTLLEQAISGYTTYACTGGTDTLTMSNGASATARNMFLELTGMGGGSLVVPANKKLYFIYNNTASAITVKVTTGVSVPATAKILLVCNGTDIVAAINYMAGATFPNPTLTGIPVAPTAPLNTSTTQIATTAFVQAAALSLSTIYPIGSIYTSTVGTSPATLFGFGTWIAFGAGRVLLSANATYTAGSTGGSADAIVVGHTHSASFSGSTLPDHTHTFPGYTNAGDDGSNPYGYSVRAGGSTTVSGASVSLTPSGTVSVGNTGASGTNANLPPYIVVYMWNRTA